MNQLFYGDNLPILRNHVKTESVDVVYLDPPFNSNQDYNVLFREESGEPAQAQIKAFTDTWHWSEKRYVEFCETCPNQMLVELVQGFVKTLGRNQVTAYVVMMAPRLIELHRVLKSTGSLYLHCDPTASHYLKVMLDCTFDARNFGNEIIWRRTGAHSPRRRFGPIHDTILFYRKSNDAFFRNVRLPYMKGHVERRYKAETDGRLKFTSGGNVLTGAGATEGESGKPWHGFDPSQKNRHWAIPGFLAEQMEPDFDELGVLAKLDALFDARLIDITPGAAWPTPVRYLRPEHGNPISDIWAYQPYTEGTVYGTKHGIDYDVEWLGPTDPERTGYQTQKPLGLLQRMILSSCPDDGLVLDPFCGCGTAVIVAEDLKRNWIGIDITHLAIALIKYRLSDSFGLKEKRDYAVIGEPTAPAEAEALAKEDRNEFQKWAVGLVPRAFPFQDKKGADTGIDGILRFRDDNAEPKKNVIQVKSGGLTLSVIRDFAHVIEREKATLGLFITLERPTKLMRLEADKVGFYTTPLGNRKIPRFQIRTIEELLNGKPFDIPQTAELTGIKIADKISRDKQIGLNL